MAARNKGSLSQQVAKQLLSDFQEGVRYRPGDKLPNENDLAGEYGVSRGTLREAIRILSSHGVLVVRRGMVERLQAEFKVVIAGPTTMAALLNSLQMGFKTLAIQKRSSEVWDVLSSVKSEFETFGTALEQAQTRINQAGNALESLVGVRTRQIQRKLRSVTTLPEAGAAGEALEE